MGGFRCRGIAADRNRTDDTRIFSPLLYRLSYSGEVLPNVGETAKKSSGRIAS